MSVISGISSQNIVLLNGPSSAGKSSILIELRELAPGATIGLSLDYFFEMQKREHQTDVWPNYRELCFGFHRTLATWAEQGFFVIGEAVLETEEVLHDAAQVLSSYQAFFVEVTCALEELERREIARGDRPIGRAKFQHEFIHSHGTYDISVDTGKLSAKECAAAILKMMGTVTPSAFKKLSSS